jgi:hypothetical protein
MVLIQDSCLKFGSNPVDYLFLLRSFSTFWNYITLAYVLFTSLPNDLVKILNHLDKMEKKTFWKIDGKLLKVLKLHFVKVL